MDNTTEIFFNFIDRYGLPIVFLWYVVQKWLTPLMLNLQERNKTLEDRQQGNSETRNLGEIINIESAITEILAQTAHSLGAQWVELWQLHNGTVSIDNIPFIRMSVTHEFSSTGFDPRLPNYQNIPISVFAKELNDLRRNGTLRISSTDEAYPAVANSYIRDRVSNGAFVCVGNARGNLIGVLSVGWHEPHDLSAEALTIEMKGYSARISILLAQLASYRNTPHRRAEDG